MYPELSNLNMRIELSILMIETEIPKDTIWDGRIDVLESLVQDLTAGL